MSRFAAGRRRHGALPQAGSRLKALLQTAGKEVMEDIRKLIEYHEAEIAPESLGYLLRGLAAATHEFVREGTPSDPKERQRHREMVYACSLLAEQYATMLSRWLGKHMDDCEHR